MTEWDRAWSALLPANGVDAVFRVGEVLKQHHCGFWLDYWEIYVAREAMVLKKELLPGRSLNEVGYVYDRFAVKLAKLAFMDQRDEVGTVWDEAAEQGVLDEILDRIRNQHGPFLEWSILNRVVPETPYMLAQRISDGTAPAACELWQQKHNH